MAAPLKPRRRWPNISITIDPHGWADVQVVGCLGYELATDTFDAYDLVAIRRSARWLRVPTADLYDLTLQARAAA